MRKYLLFIALLLVSMSGRAQEIEWHDAVAFPLYGKISDATNARYERLPGYLEKVCREPVWTLGRNSAGLYIRFRSNSPVIHLKWESLFNKFKTHMPDTATKGMDLYMLTDDGWRFMKCCPLKRTKNQQTMIECDPVEREYMVYLSLYDGVVSLEIGVEKGSLIGQPQCESPRTEKPVIMYGSSILQGGCASRPGMAHTNILSRRLNREVINLGFSGNALIDYEIAELMASHKDPGVFVLDYVPNATGKHIDDRAEKFFRILRDAHPDVPIIFVELPNYPRAGYNTKQGASMKSRNDAQRRIYDKMRKAGEKKLYYIKSDGMLGDDGEATVDGTHFSDLGMMRYVEHVLPTIKKALSRN